MPLLAGDARVGTGLAGAIDAKMRASIPGYRPDLAWQANNAIAAALVEYITANGVVSVDVTITTLDAGLQGIIIPPATVPVPTLGPTASKTLTGTGTLS